MRKGNLTVGQRQGYCCAAVNRTAIKNEVVKTFVRTWREIEATHLYIIAYMSTLGLSYAVSANKGMVYNHIPLIGGHWQMKTGKDFSVLLHLIQIVEITREYLFYTQGKFIDFHIERYGMPFGFDEDDAGSLLYAITLCRGRVGTSTIASM